MSCLNNTYEIMFKNIFLPTDRVHRFFESGIGFKTYIKAMSKGNPNLYECLTKQNRYRSAYTKPVSIPIQYLKTSFDLISLSGVISLFALLIESFYINFVFKIIVRKAFLSVIDHHHKIIGFGYN